MYFGACYYPEHWPEERWETDAAMMKEAKFNVVRMGEFAWVRMEPSDGQFDFAWLDRAIAQMEANGIEVILGTPTAGPPKWLMDKHPDAYQRDIYGHVRGFGTRRHYCFNNANFRKHTEQIVTQMAKQYGENTNVIGWQIDNEFGMIDTARCYCDSCLQQFRIWLKEKYGTIDAVNEAWGTIFSSQTYPNWETIHLPTYSVHQGHNPGFALDFRRFSSDSVRSYQKLQIDILRQYAPDHVITTNEMGKFNQIDFFHLSEDLDISSLDVYPIMKSKKKDQPAYGGFQHDVTRGFRQQNYWVLEHLSGTPGSGVLAPTPKPGELRRWTYQSVAHGADGIVYFRWRTLPYSIEEYWHGILQHHGEVGRKYEEVKQIGSELEKLRPLLRHTTPKAKVAMIRSYDNEWAFEIQPHIRDYEYMKHFEKYYRYFYDRGIVVDVLSPDVDYGQYDLIIAPHLMMAKGTTVQKLYKYVEDGGTFLTDYRTGAKRMNNQITTARLPGDFRELLGIGIEDYGIIHDEDPNLMRIEDGEYEVDQWYDVIELREAEAIATFTSNYFAGSAAVTRNSYGKGLAYYVGTEPGDEGMRILLDEVSRAAGVQAKLPNLPEGIEVVEREAIDSAEKTGLLFIINHNEHDVRVPLDDAYEDVLTNEHLKGFTNMSAQAVHVLRKI